MILKPDLIYVEFLEHFLAVIQDEHARNAASMLSGCLRSTPVSRTTKNLLCKDSSYLPLSALIQSGCIVDGMVSSNAQAKRLQLFFDETRVQGALRKLGMDYTKYNHIQQIILVTCCQEASNRTLTGGFQLFAENAATILDKPKQTRILEMLGNLHVRALSSIVSKLHFDSDLNLTPEAILAIKEQKDKFIELANTNSFMEIPDAELMAISGEDSTTVPAHERIPILNELSLLLTIDTECLTPSELLEHQAHIHLLKFHCSLLAMTYKDLWQVKAQWIATGTELVLGETRITLPYSISRILELIKSNKSKTTPGKYLSSLHEIQEIARTYEADWYTWTRNQVSFLASAPAVKEFLAEVLAINMGPAPKTSTVVEEPGLLESVLYYGLSFFTPVEPDKEETTYSKGWELNS